VIANDGWSWWAVEVDGPDEKPDCYKVNEPSRDAAIAAATREYGDGSWIAIVEATKEGSFLARPFEEGGDCRLMDRLLEAFQDDNSERWGEDGPEFGFSTDSLAKALNDAFERFISENMNAVMEGVWAFTGQRNHEVIPPSRHLVEPG
jgi:hypothetical protein